MIKFSEGVFSCALICRDQDGGDCHQSSRSRSQGRLHITHFPDGTTERSEYDLEGRREFSYDRALRETRYEYDPMGRLRKTFPPGGGFSERVYDAAGRLTASIDEEGVRVEYGYDLADRRISVTQVLPMQN